MLRKDNLLLLDEPTNHLDMDSREVLEDALTDFGGTIITVSHDRYFINRIANRIIEMQPDGVTEYIGNYDDYIERKNRPVAVEAEAGKTKTELEKEKRREKLSRQALRQLKIRAQEAEKAVGVKEAEIAELEAQMADPSLYSDAQKSADVQRAYQKHSRRFKRFTNSGRLPRPPCLRRKPDIFCNRKRGANNHAFYRNLRRERQRKVHAGRGAGNDSRKKAS